jgi:hypothetical protein
MSAHLLLLRFTGLGVRADQCKVSVIFFDFNTSHPFFMLSSQTNSLNIIIHKGG